jgi:hypothetical protein
LTKSDIIKEFTNDEELQKYVPTPCNPSTVTRSFLLSLMFNVKRNKYLELYNKYKQKEIDNSTNCGKIYEVIVGSSFANELNNYISTSK